MTVKGIYYGLLGGGYIRSLVIDPEGQSVQGVVQLRNNLFQSLVWRDTRGGL